MKKNLIKYYDEETGEEIMSSHHIIEFVCNPNSKLCPIKPLDFCKKYGFKHFKAKHNTINEFVMFNKWTDTSHLWNFRLALRMNLIMLDTINSKTNKEGEHKLVWYVQDLMKQMKKDPKFKHWDYYSIEQIIPLFQAKIEIDDKKCRVIWFW